MEDISSRSLKLTRTLDAPIELVWEILTHPEYIQVWWGPDGFTNTVRKMEMKQGGQWDFTMHAPDGTDFINQYVCSTFIPMKAMVLEHHGDPKFSIHVTLHEHGDSTTIEWVNIFATVPGKEEAVRAFKADIGLIQNVNRLEKVINLNKR